MPIKMRTTADPTTKAAAIEAFGAAAEDSTVDEPVRTAPTTPKREPVADMAWPVDVAKTFLIRYPDPELPILLAELARLEERSQHATALRARRRGIDALRAEAR